MAFSRQRILTAFLPVTLALTMIGCGKTGSDEKASEPPPVPAAVAHPRADFKADPNPITAVDRNRLGVTKLTWNTSATKGAEVHVGKPDGALLCAGHETGSCTTGQWVSDGMVFYLQDSGAVKPTDASATLAVVTAKVQ
jgi:hypothetical protein